MAKSLKRKMESTKAGKKIDKAHLALGLIR